MSFQYNSVEFILEVCVFSEKKFNNSIILHIRLILHIMVNQWKMSSFLKMEHSINDCYITESLKKKNCLIQHIRDILFSAKTTLAYSLFKRNKQFLMFITFTGEINCLIINFILQSKEYKHTYIVKFSYKKSASVHSEIKKNLFASYLLFIVFIVTHT